MGTIYTFYIICIEYSLLKPSESPYPIVDVDGGDGFYSVSCRVLLNVLFNFRQQHPQIGLIAIDGEFDYSFLKKTPPHSKDMNCRAKGYFCFEVFIQSLSGPLGGRGAPCGRKERR